MALSCDKSTIIDTPSQGDGSTATASFWIYLPINEYPTSNMVVFVDNHSKLAFGFYDGTSSAIISCNKS
jgi:hypothetical protein